MSSATPNSGDDESASEAVSVGHDDDGPSPSHAVVEAVAGAAGVGPIDLGDEEGIVLYDHVNLDALDALVASHSGPDLNVSLSVAEYEVSVDATTVVAEERTQ